MSIEEEPTESGIEVEDDNDGDDIAELGPLAVGSSTFPVFRCRFRAAD